MSVAPVVVLTEIIRTAEVMRVPPVALLAVPASAPVVATRQVPVVPAAAVPATAAVVPVVTRVAAAVAVATALVRQPPTQRQRRPVLRSPMFRRPVPPTLPPVSRPR